MTSTQTEHVIEIHKEVSEVRRGKLNKYWSTCSCGRFKSKKSQSDQKAERAGGDHLRGMGSRPL